MNWREQILQDLKNDPQVSVLILGGGINGAGLFRELALQGVDCLLVDKSDFAAGALTEEQYLACEDGCCTGAGACGVMGTGNTMQVFAEACGLALPGNAIAPGESAELERLAYRAGGRVVQDAGDVRAAGIAGGCGVARCQAQDGVDGFDSALQELDGLRVAAKPVARLKRGLPPPQ